MELRVISFNIHHGESTLGHFDLEGQATVLWDSGADIAFLQEVDVKSERSGWVDQVEVLAKLAGFPYFAFGRNREVQGGGYGNAILSRFPLSPPTNHLIPLDEPDRPRPFLGRNRYTCEQRGILHAAATIHSQTVHLFCSHFGFLANEPQDGTRALLDLIRPIQEPIIFGGDLNAWEERDGEISPLREVFTDCALALGHGRVKTWPARGPRLRLDYIFVRGDYRPVNFWAVPTLTSDHHPVVVELNPTVPLTDAG